VVWTPLAIGFFIGMLIAIGCCLFCMAIAILSRGYWSDHTALKEVAPEYQHQHALLGRFPGSYPPGAGEAHLGPRRRNV
jgi:hypothetical protein